MLDALPKLRLSVKQKASVEVRESGTPVQSCLCTPVRSSSQPSLPYAWTTKFHYLYYRWWLSEVKILQISKLQRCKAVHPAACPPLLQGRISYSIGNLWAIWALQCFQNGTELRIIPKTLISKHVLPTLNSADLHNHLSLSAGCGKRWQQPQRRSFTQITFSFWVRFWGTLPQHLRNPQFLVVLARCTHRGRYWATTRLGRGCKKAHQRLLLTGHPARVFCWLTRLVAGWRILISLSVVPRDDLELAFSPKQ